MEAQLKPEALEKFALITELFWRLRRSRPSVWIS
jgi:hypothetical protein